MSLERRTTTSQTPPNRYFLTHIDQQGYDHARRILDVDRRGDPIALAASVVRLTEELAKSREDAERAFEEGIRTQMARRGGL